jgi:signal transduction histidine kinase
MRAWPPLRIDAALAVLLLVETVVETSFADDSWAARLAVLGPALVVAAGLVLRRREPVGAAALAAVGIAATSLLRPEVRDTLEGLFFAWLFVTYSMAIREDGRRLVAGIVLAEAGMLAAVALDDAVSIGDLAFGSVIFVLAPVFAGRMLRGRIQLERALAEKAEQVDRERARRTDEVATDERARIAGELHDVVAHALGAMTIQAAAARRLAAKDAPRAAGAFEAIEHTGREALGELRTLLEVLRGEASEADDAALMPQPGLAHLDALVRRVCRAGLPTDLEQHGVPPDALPAGVDLTAYRVVQAALEDALRSGGADHAWVTVRFLDDELRLEIHDDGSRDGRRLLGMQERVRVVGGQIEAEHRQSGGHQVVASLPLEGVPA